MHQNLQAWVGTASLAAGYLGVCRTVGKAGLPRYVTRKIIHIGTGPLFMLCWPMYTESSWSPALCASVPALASLQFALVGSGMLSDPKLVATSSRTGDARELLVGPILYGATHAAAAALGWRGSPAAVCALCALCGGDGMAELGGRWLPRVPLPWNRDKTLGGLASCVAGAFLLSTALLAHFQRLGLLQSPGAWALLGAACVAAAAESLPLSDWDNGLVPLVVWAWARGMGWA